ncbi:MAG TPA: hypothetical protein PKV71_02070 [Calditrichia bacterium]|nr:hypothetical protein [Calditrichota bacterium]HQU74382.1 hypothetical protein [Calditrichia bacterium]HQV30628.1 hypothetical protein [Calditrichia bacterium]
MSEQDKKNMNHSDSPEREEIENILGQITEQEDGSESRPAAKPTTEPDEIIKKPSGSTDQPEDLEGLLDKISEKPQREPKKGFFQRLFSFFKKS